MQKRLQRNAQSAGRVVADRLLKMVNDERKTIDVDISFLLSTGGVRSLDLSFDRDGLVAVEESYWELAAATDDELIETYERKMAIFLGECILRELGGEWVIYDGREVVYSPVVVRVKATGLHHDVFLLCSDLRNKPGVLGQSKKRALSTYFKTAGTKGFP